MSILVLQHDSGGLGRLSPILRDNAHRTDIRRLDLPVGRGGGTLPRDLDGVSGVIALGGPMNVADSDKFPWLAQELDLIRDAHTRQLPLVGICLGHQLIAKALGGEVVQAPKPEWGFTRMQQTPSGNVDIILAGIPWGSYQFQMHFQEVTTAPEGATVLAGSAACKIQAFRVGLRTYGFQYHFEHTRAMLDALVRDQAAGADMQQAGLTPAEFQKQIAEHAEIYDRLSTRLVNNLVTFMFPARKKIKA